jgi:hydroxyacylglutathione hydrolase
MTITVQPLPAFTDNYIWALDRAGEAIVVDPGDGTVVQRWLEAGSLRLAAIVITHHHPDHTGGIALLRKTWDVPVYGPRAEHPKIAGLTTLLDDGDEIELFGERYTVIAVPGHTLGHIAYYGAGRLFCGDTLFSAGCGRLFEGTPAQMHASLSRLAALPGDTRVYCTHEYTTSNLAFANAVEPGNAALQARIAEVRELRAHERPSLPSTIALERAHNPFLRGDMPAVRAAA